MRRYAAKVDKNQPEIVCTLRQIGCTVFDASHVGGGFPDLVVGFRNKTLLMEIKNGLLVPKNRSGLTPAQLFFTAGWRGHYSIARDSQDAIDIVTEATCR